jgi:ABC transport system ATP-binding/permease protein
MPLVTITDLSIRFRGPSLFDDVQCLIDDGERIGLLGRNGAGKTTFMRILAGLVTPDHGSALLAPGAKVALLRQDVPQDISGTIANVVHGGVGTATATHDEHEADWQRQHAVDQILSRMELDPHARFESLSSGMKRRVLLAKALVDSPDLLLLDEPTNHLDIDSIEWLEEFLQRWPKAFMFITHDRMFLRKLARRILEIDAGRLFDWSCDYETFLKRKEEALAASDKQNALFDKRLAEEEAWIRQGIKARRTRNEGRVRALKEMRRERADRRDKVGTANLKIQDGLRSGNLIIDAQQVSVAYGAHRVLDGFSTTIMRGDKIGIIGRNGAGKTTLLRTLLGHQPPDSGSIRLGTNLQIAYFDQLRAQLDGEKTIEEEVGDGYQTVEIGGKSMHVIGYLKEFLFTPERSRSKIKLLSGGERNRVLLAKLFAKPTNVIILDEPTNDLDAETLEMLEERLIEYQGTLLVVSHDREFLNNVVTSCIVFEDGGVREYVGGYDDWLRQSATRSLNSKPTASQGRGQDGNTTNKPVAHLQAATLDKMANRTPTKLDTSSSRGKLSYKETQELNRLPSHIEELEAMIASKHERMAAPDFYKRPREEIVDEQASLDDLEQQLSAAYERWSDLESRQ